VKAPLYIDDPPGISLSEMRAKARRLQQSTGRLDLVVVDYLQLMSAGVRRYDNRTQGVSAISRGLKALSKELKAPVMALSQLSRGRKPVAVITGRSLPILGNQARSSKMPLWRCSSSARKCRSLTIQNSMAEPM
jgi:replicative DNA helicase